jgi:hypothetical protein
VTDTVSIGPGSNGFTVQDQVWGLVDYSNGTPVPGDIAGLMGLGFKVSRLLYCISSVCHNSLIFRIICAEPRNLAGDAVLGSSRLERQVDRASDEFLDDKVS